MKYTNLKLWQWYYFNTFKEFRDWENAQFYFLKYEKNFY